MARPGDPAEIRVETTWDEDAGTITQRMIDDRLADFGAGVQASVIDTKEEHIRQALAALGWTPPPRFKTIVPATRWRAEGCQVYQGDALVIVCHAGEDGQKPEDIAQRVAELLNADFERFVQSVAANIEKVSE